MLYQLCRPHKTVAQQVALLDALRVLTVNRNLVLGPGNHDQDFVACLAHCFICLYSGRWVHVRLICWRVCREALQTSSKIVSVLSSFGQVLFLIYAR